jgi:serine/threonine protein kinase
MNLEVGQTIGQYTIQKRVGSGGMAVVYEAEHAKLGRRVALKMMHAGFQDDDDLLARFNREARIVAALDHPNIVPVYDFDEHNGTPYLVMKFITGNTLKWHMRKRPLSLEEISTICAAVADALAYAHEQGVLHRDVKPGNVILDDDNIVYLTDFGLARIAAQGESSLSAGMIVGTPHYIAPEQATGETTVGVGADVYALGVMLYEMVVGRVPFAADSAHAIIHDHIYTPPPLPSELNPELPTAVEMVLLSALEKDPADRPTTPRDLMQDFQRALEESGLTALSDDRSEIAERSMAAKREKRGGTPADTSAAKPVVQTKDGSAQVEAEWDLGKMAQNVGRGIGSIGETFKESFASKPKINDDKPYTPPSEAELETQIRKRVTRRIHMRRGWLIHVSIFSVVNGLLMLAGLFGQNIARESIAAQSALGNIPPAEAELAIVWSTQPWLAVMALFWFGGIMSHRMQVGNVSARTEDKRHRKLMRRLEHDYGADWQAVITESQYIEAESAVNRRFNRIKHFWGHVWWFISGNVALRFAWEMVVTGLIATQQFVELNDPVGAAAMEEIITADMAGFVMVVWAVILVLHGLQVVFRRRSGVESELMRERRLTRSRQTPRPADKRKHAEQAALALEDVPAHSVHLTADGELTNSTVEAYKTEN